MLIGAALIELELSEADSIKVKRRIVNSIKDRVTHRFNVSVAEVDDQDERRSICIGVAKVGIDPRHLRRSLEKVVAYVESLGLAEIVGDDVAVARLDELELVEPDAELEPDAFVEEP